jgi:hypothetical protein
VFAVLGVIVGVIVIGGIIGAIANGSKGGNASHALEQQIMTDGATQIQANLTNLAGGGGTVRMDDVNCVQTAGTQQYTCIGHYSVTDASLGLSDQKYMLNISATCDSDGNCQWHSDGEGQPVG